MNDPWREIRLAFPEECDRRSDIVEFVHTHPGCRSSDIRTHLGLEGAGLFRVLFQLHKDGFIVLERGLHGISVPDDRACPSEGMISTESTVKCGPKGSA